MKTLLLFTGSYPYSVAAENTFLPQEIEVVCEHFDNVIVIPAAIGGTCETIDAKNVTVNTAYAEFAASKPHRLFYLLLSVADRKFIEECIAQLPLFLRHPSAFLRAVRYYVRSKMTQKWIKRLCLEQEAPRGDCVLYTWWFDGVTLGLSSYAIGKGVPVITRAHGYDLYENRHSPSYIPFRKLALEQITAVYADSNAGARYLTDRYPLFAERISVRLLGIEDPGFISSPSADGRFRLLSCSFLLPVKRIDLIVRGLAHLGHDFPQRRFYWTHIGNGPERESLLSFAAKTLPANVNWEFMEYPGRAPLLDYYRNTPVDIFVNASQSEGTPISIMEAISVGVPVIATAVGGNKEIVGPENGILVGADPEPKEIADAIISILDDEEKMKRLRLGSRTKWQTYYSAQTNYSLFAQAITGLTKGKSKPCS